MRTRTATIAAAAALAFPAGAAAQEPGNTGTDCSYASNGGETDQTVPVSSGTVTVYAGSGGLTGGGDVVVGACANRLAVANLDGVAVEAGAGGPDEGNPEGAPGAYAIVDGDNQNTDPFGVTDGYAGVSNYESGATGSCNGGGSGSNSGGCTSIDGVPPLPAGVLACGNTSGNTWNNTARDGCADPYD